MDNRPKLTEKDKRKWIMDNLKVATWNVRGIAGKEAELLRIFEENKVNIAVVTETKKKNKGSKYVGDYAMFYSGVDEKSRAARGVAVFIDKKWQQGIQEYHFESERILYLKIKYGRGHIIVIGAYAPVEGEADETVDFYNRIQKIIDKNKNHEILLMGDMNARVGNVPIPNIVGVFGEDTLNDNGEVLREFATFNELKITNTFFRKKEIHKYTWSSRGLRSLIDYIIISKKLAKQVSDTRVYRGYDVFSDHYLVISQIRLYTKWKKIKTSTRQENKEVFKVYLLEQESIRRLYQDRLNRHLNSIPSGNSIEEEWRNMKRIIVQAANEAIGVKKRFRKRKGLKIWTEEIEEAVAEKQKVYLKYLNSPSPTNAETYKEVRNRAKTIVRQAHRQSWERFISNIEHDVHGRQVMAYKIMKMLNGKEREEVSVNPITVELWKKHYTQLWYSEDEEEGVITECDAESIDAITLEELLQALRESKNRTSPGLNGINIELLKYGGILLQLRLLHFLNMCWKEHSVPKEWLRARVISLFKRGDRTRTDNYRGISILDTTYKLYARIVNGRLKPITEVLLLEEQNGFRKGRSCIDAIFTLKLIIEKRREFNRETHLAFVDIAKAFDNVRRSLLWNIMERRGFPTQLIAVLQSLYNRTSITLDLNGRLTEDIPTNKGVRQGCPISPTLFNIYIDDVLRLWKTKVDSGIQLQGDIYVNSLLYADDKVIIQETEDQLQKAIFTFNTILRNYGLRISAAKSKTMAFLGKRPIRTKIVVDNQTLEQVCDFNYLGYNISYNVDTDWVNKLSKFRSICGTIHRNLRNKTRKETRMKFYKTVAVPTFLYASETWTLGKGEEKKIQAAEMRFLRSVQGFSLLDRRRNIDIRQDLKIQSLNETIKEYKRRWCGHVARMPDTRLPVAALKYKPSGRRDVGRPRRRWVPEQAN